MKNFEVKNAATIIVLRGSHENSKILMGQRGEGASFMPNKFVFPGGAVDNGDSGIIPNDRIDKEMLLNLKIKSESGIESAQDVASLADGGANAILVGESLMRDVASIPQRIAKMLG